tara:strand:+ start:354 stop:623 length:270 start_codon:yes stop_codon:yes gene_type:complete
MKLKKISFKVLEEDIRGIARNSISLVIGRLGTRFQKNTSQVSEALTEGNSVDILTEVQNVIEGLEESIKELQNLADLIGEIPDIEDTEE